MEFKIKQQLYSRQKNDTNHILCFVARNGQTNHLPDWSYWYVDNAIMIQRVLLLICYPPLSRIHWRLCSLSFTQPQGCSELQFEDTCAWSREGTHVQGEVRHRRGSGQPQRCGQAGDSNVWSWLYFCDSKYSKLFVSFFSAYQQVLLN